MFTPNLVILPLAQFKITVTITCLKTSETAKETLYSYVDLDGANYPTITL